MASGRMAVTFFSTLQHSDVVGDSFLAVGFTWIPTPTAEGWTTVWAMLGWSQVLQLLVPAGLAWLMVRGAGRQRGRLVAA